MKQDDLYLKVKLTNWNYIFLTRQKNIINFV